MFLNNFFQIYIAILIINFSILNLYIESIYCKFPRIKLTLFLFWFY